MHRGKHRSGRTIRWGKPDHVARHGKREQTLDEFVSGLMAEYGLTTGRW